MLIIESPSRNVVSRQESRFLEHSTNVELQIENKQSIETITFNIVTTTYNPSCRCLLDRTAPSSCEKIGYNASRHVNI